MSYSSQSFCSLYDLNERLAIPPVFSGHLLIVFASTCFVVVASRIFFYFQLIQKKLDKKNRREGWKGIKARVIFFLKLMSDTLSSYFYIYLCESSRDKLFVLHEEEIEKWLLHGLESLDQLTPILKIPFFT